MTMRRWHAFVTVALFLLVGCAEQRDPINRVQPEGVVEKSALEGEWFFQQTVIDMETSATYAVIGDNSFAGLERVRWDIQENWLYARRSFEMVENSDNSNYLESGTSSGPTLYEDGTPYMGPIVAAFRIESHFDIMHEYNPTTGEEINVVVENSTDRPWQQREYIRVDWSENLATDYDFDYFYAVKGELEFDPIPYYVQSDGPPEHQPVFNYDDDDNLDYFDVTLRMAVHPGMVYYEPLDDEFPYCWFEDGTDCATTVLTVRSSFMKVNDAEQDFEPFVHTGQRTEMFGFWDVERERYSHRTGYRVQNKTRYAMLHNIWQRSHTDESCQTDEACTVAGSRCDLHVGLQLGLCAVPWDELHLDVDCESDDECAELVEGSLCESNGAVQQCTLPGVSNHESQACEVDDECRSGRCLVEGRCTIPFAERTPRPIVYYLTGGWPMDLDDTWAQVESEWDSAFRNAVAAAQGLESEADAPQMLYICHSPVRPGEPEACGEAGLTVRLGDLRYNQIYYSNEWNPESPLGMSPAVADPLSGRIQGVGIVMYDAIDVIAHNIVENIWLMTGRMEASDYIGGLSVEALREEIGDAYERDTSPEDVRAMFQARNTRQRQGTSPSEPAGILPEGYGSEVMPRLIEQLRQSGAHDPSRSGADGFMRALRGSRIEELMLDDEMLWAANFEPGTTLTDEVRDRASPLSPLNGMIAQARRERAERRDFLRNAERIELTDMSIERLADEVADMTWEEAYRTIRPRVWQTVVIHELGHSFGMFHNFTGNEDTVNFPEEWWAARTDDFTRVPRHRIDDPVTEDEIAGGIYELGYSSVMDYSPAYHHQDHLGRYDRAAILYGYGRHLEVYEDSSGINDGLLREYWTSRGTPLQFGRTPVAFHYTELYQAMGRNLFDPENRRVVSLDGLQDDNMTWVDGETGETHQRVPYLFCSDYHADLGDNCHRWDFGVDVYERMQWYVSRDAWNYITLSFRRGLVAADDPASFVERMYSRYYNRFKLMHDYYVLIDSIIGQVYGEVERERFMTDLQTGWGGYTVAVHDAFNALANTLVRPDAGYFDRITRPDGQSVFAPPEGMYVTQEYFILPIGHSRYFATTWWDPASWDEGAEGEETFEDCGIYFWDCFHHHGYYLNKIMALMALSDSETFFVARDTAQDVRQWRISFFDDYSDQIIDLVGGLMSEDHAAVAPYVTAAATPGGTDPEYFARDFAWPAADPVLTGEVPRGAAAIDPSAGFSVQLYAAVLGLSRFQTNYDNRFITASRLWIRGGDSAADPSSETVEYEDPETGLVYQAVAVESGRGIAQRMIDHANALKARSSACDADDETAADACEDVEAEDRARADVALALYRDQLDFMVNLTSQYDSWQLAYPDPYNPGGSESQ
jgi:hypothetical protein